ncbi:Uncharacterized protein GBIM_09869 [Gryllus bimaculatus]|nr:Uncharacterized protein GBIM_09869 [Gryllus bimaculatus]
MEAKNIDMNKEEEVKKKNKDGNKMEMEESGEEITLFVATFFIIFFLISNYSNTKYPLKSGHTKESYSLYFGFCQCNAESNLLIGAWMRYHKYQPFKMGRGDAEDLSEEYRQILQSLKGTAEGLLINQVSNVWNIYGGLNRLHHVMEKIFKHGCRVFDQDGDPDCWVFIQGLSWLQPSLSASPTLLTDEEGSPNLPPSVSGKALVWLYKSLEGHTLSQKLSWLLSDRDHLLSCFEKSAYLCQEKYGQATLICLRAVEQNQPSLLTDIDPCLYLASWNFRVFHKTHRKCSSFPDTKFNPRYHGRRRFLLEKQISADAHLSEIMSRVPMKKSPLGTGCFGSDIRDADKEEEEDRQSFCEEATECTFAGDNDSAATNDSNNQEDESESLENSAATTTAEAKLPDVVQIVKRWYSLPSLVNAACSEASREALSSTSDGNSSSCTKLIVHSYPSSPTRGPSRSSSLVFRSPEQSPLETSTSVSAQSPCSKLSPSVLEIDYSTIEQHSDNDVPLSQRCPRNWRNGNAKLVTKGTCLKRQLFCGDEPSVKSRPLSTRSTAVLNTLVTSSGSSDTLNHEASRLKLSQASTSKGNVPWLQTSVRPCELKLPRTHWEESELDAPRSQSRIKKTTGKTRRVSLGVVGSAPEYAHEWMGAVDGSRRRVHKKSFIEDGGSSVLPMATGFFPRPTQGQSLASFLSSGQFARPSAELDRENAHFSVCEAMIAAIELVKCNQQLAVAVVSKVRAHGEKGAGGDGDGVCGVRAGAAGGGGGAGSGSGPADESDEEANPLKQRIRLRRRQRQQQHHHHRRQIQVWNSQLLSDGRTDTTTTDQSISPLSSSPGTPSESLSTDGVDDLEVDEVQNLAQLKNSGLSVSMASLYSEADLSRPATSSTSVSRAPDAGLTESVVSAEGVALSLLRQFSDKQLPRASDLQWLVSEQDAPQQLLPLPTSWPVSPDEAEDADMRQATPLRGTTDWAPPRPQVIFTPHPSPVRRVLMAKQNYRCAGCGMKVAVEYAHRFRYCEYLGRFFCTGCHTNQLALIPGRVLTRWDFTRKEMEEEKKKEEEEEKEEEDEEEKEEDEEEKKEEEVEEEEEEEEEEKKEEEEEMEGGGDLKM